MKHYCGYLISTLPFPLEMLGFLNFTIKLPTYSNIKFTIFFTCLIEVPYQKRPYLHNGEKLEEIDKHTFKEVREIKITNNFWPF